MQELDRPDEDPIPGRHRAPSSAAGLLSLRLGIAALGVLLATGLGAVTADVLGLTEVARGTAQAGPPRAIPPEPEEEPRARGTVELAARPALPPPPEVRPAEPSPEQPPPAAAPESPGRLSPAADAPAPVGIVRTGESCPAIGRTAITDRGRTAVCTASRGNGPNKWRAA